MSMAKLLYVKGSLTGMLTLTCIVHVIYDISTCGCGINASDLVGSKSQITG